MKNIDKTTLQMTVETMKKIDPYYKGVRIKVIFDEFIKLYPEFSSKRYDSFSADLAYHCINIRSRFPDYKNKKQKYVWQSNPLFYRIYTGIYRLLKEDEIKLFKKAIDKDLPLIYEDEYTIEELEK